MTDLLTTEAAILEDVPLERLEAEISGFASRLAAATAIWLSILERLASTSASPTDWSSFP
jgi:hypothetical protein